MPEGDNVHLTARALHEALAGRILTKTDFRVPALATVDLAGATVREAVARGKHLLVRTDDGRTIHSHLMMDGAWHVYRAGARWRAPAHEARVVLAHDGREAVGFRVKQLEVVPTGDESRLVGHLGPDVLGDDWDPERAVRRMRVHADEPIGDVLLDQTVVAGWGNVYRNEICFLRGLDPATPVRAIADLAAVVDLGKRLIEANRAHGRHITTGDTRRGRERYVYGRGGEPCRRCGTRILRTAGRDPERVTFRCPTCQPRASERLEASGEVP